LGAADLAAFVAALAGAFTALVVEAFGAAALVAVVLGAAALRAGAFLVVVLVAAFAIGNSSLSDTWICDCAYMDSVAGLVFNSQKLWFCQVSTGKGL
jgi:hypothetical protein